VNIGRFFRGIRVQKKLYRKSFEREIEGRGSGKRKGEKEKGEVW
jgi:stalled ribosome alternative rescue factor ArfA